MVWLQGHIHITLIVPLSLKSVFLVLPFVRYVYSHPYHNSYLYIQRSILKNEPVCGSFLIFWSKGYFLLLNSNLRSAEVVGDVLTVSEPLKCNGWTSAPVPVCESRCTWWDRGLWLVHGMVFAYEKCISGVCFVFCVFVHWVVCLWHVSNSTEWMSLNALATVLSLYYAVQCLPVPNTITTSE